MTIERKCPICGCKITINDTSVSIQKTIINPVTNITCLECKKFIKENVTSG